MVGEFVALFQTDFYLSAWSFLTATWPVWLPLLLFGVGINTWLSYKRRAWLLEQGYIVLEVRLPREVEKSPAAMEMVLEGIFDPASGNLYDAYGKGRVRDWFSLEIATVGGKVKFFIVALPKWKKTIEARVYAHYPGAEVHEVEDYARGLSFDPKTQNLWGAVVKLDKADALPIKSYIDYELEKANKEQEEIVDPLSPLLEYFGTVRSDEVASMQILIQANRKEGLLDGRLIPKPDWSGGPKEEIKKIIEKDAYIKPNGDKGPTMQNLTSVQSDAVRSIERNSTKPAFDAVVRFVYLAPKDVYDAGRIGGFLGALRPFASKRLNGFKPNWMTNIDYPWKDFRDRKKILGQKTHLEAFKKRSFFNVPFKNLNGKPFILTSEELATIYHFPGSTATTPTLARVPSKKAEAPANLPI